MLNAVIEIAIGLIVLFSMLSLVTTKINELIATVLNLRARNLRKAIRHLVGQEYSVKIYDHPFITALYRGSPNPTKNIKRWFEKPGPSYVPAEKFVIALLDSTCPAAVKADPPLPPDPGDRLQYALVSQAAADAESSGADGGAEGQLPPPTPASVGREIDEQLDRVTDAELQHTLKILWSAASNNVVAFRAGIEGWFNHTMDRASGWYKRTAQAMALGLGLALAIALNVDTIHVTERLWTDGPLRSAVLEQVKKLPSGSATTTSSTAPSSTTTTVAGAPAPPAPATTTPGTVAPPSTDVPIGDQVEGIQNGLSSVSALQLPLGWDKGQRPDSYPLALVGWVLTAIALSLGAPFWFDLLNKVTALRGGGTQETTPAQSPKKAVPPK